jgi:archaellum component FlaC
MSVTEADIIDLKSRVTRLERASVNNTETIGWMAGMLGTIKSIQDTHTKRMDGIDARFDRVDSDIREVKADLRAVKATVEELRDELPGIVAAAMREVMRKP